MNKKGFTLIELLAVIVILAIIALISMPIIIGIIDDARRGAAEDSAYGVVQAADYYYVQQLYSTGGSFSGYTCSFGPEENGVTSCNDADKGLPLKATKPTAGTVTISSDGKVTTTGLEINGFTLTQDADGKFKAKKSSETANQPSGE